MQNLVLYHEFPYLPPPRGIRLQENYIKKTTELSTADTFPSENK